MHTHRAHTGGNKNKSEAISTKNCCSCLHVLLFSTSRSIISSVVSGVKSCILSIRLFDSIRFDFILYVCTCSHSPFILHFISSVYLYFLPPTYPFPSSLVMNQQELLFFFFFLSFSFSPFLGIEFTFYFLKILNFMTGWSCRNLIRPDSIHSKEVT